MDMHPKQLIRLALPTPEGEFLAFYSQNGLCRLDFPTGEPAARAPQPGPDTKTREWHQLTCNAVIAILAGKPPGRFPPLDLAQGTAFQKRVWAALSQIAPRQTRSYGEIAAQIGRPNATRAVGRACGANPIPLLIPCHRVLAANRQLGGFSAGLPWKRRLLDREGFRYEDQPSLLSN